MERSRCGDDGRHLRSIAAGEPCSDSLISNENSLFRRIGSLFRRKISLFDCAGNSIKKANQYGRLGRRIKVGNAGNRENSLYFPWISGNPRGEWFAGDCAIRHLLSH